ncbi:MAG: hypothetical protein C0623_12010 [Desulfuromonas sp.]|nr:MAG: hypothetical protein C0623_12010 [Desulfuromonas sp.]
MIDSHSPSKWTSLQKLVFLTFFSCAVWLVIFPIKDFDTFWHLANGTAMLDQKRIINEEIFSYSVYGKPFINHSWLAQIIMSTIHQIGGIILLIATKAVITSFIFLIIFKSSRILRASIPLAAFSGYAAILAGLSRYVVRPQLFSYAALAFLFWFLNKYLKEGFDRKLFIILPVLMILWDYMHGPAVFGFSLWIGIAFGELGKYIIARKMSVIDYHGIKKIKTIWFWLFISLLMVLTKPLGLDLYTATFKIMDNNFIIAMTGEFMPTDWQMLFIPFWLLLGATSLTILFRLKHIDITHLVILIPFSYLGIRYNRGVGVYAIVAAPLFAFYASQLWHSSEIIQRTKKAIVGLAYVFFIAVIAWTIHLKGLPVKSGEFDPSGLRTGLGINNVFLPMGTVNFIKKVGPKGNMYNNDRLGGLFSYYLYPENKIFHYNHPLLFQDIYGYLHNPALRKQWNHNYAVLSTEDEIRMFRRENWVTVYRDAVAYIMVKPTIQNKSIIDRYKVTFFTPLLPDSRIIKIFKRPALAGTLLREMSNYLSFNNDQRIGSLFAKGVALNQQNYSNAKLNELIKNATTMNPQIKNLLPVGNYN